MVWPTGKRGGYGYLLVLVLVLVRVCLTFTIDVSVSVVEFVFVLVLVVVLLLALMFVLMSVLMSGAGQLMNETSCPNDVVTTPLGLHLIARPCSFCFSLFFFCMAFSPAVMRQQSLALSPGRSPTLLSLFSSFLVRVALLLDIPSECFFWFSLATPFYAVDNDHDWIMNHSGLVHVD